MNWIDKSLLGEYSHYKGMEEDATLYVLGDAGQEESLISAGIEHAAGLVAALATDTENVFLVLTARQLNPNLHIVAISGQEGSSRKLLATGALSMAQRILRPAVTNFLDIAMRERKDILMEEIPVNGSSELKDVKLKDSGIRQKMNIILIAIKEADGAMKFNPSSETVLKEEQTVIAVGDEQSLQQLEKILNP